MKPSERIELYRQEMIEFYIKALKTELKPDIEDREEVEQAIEFEIKSSPEIWCKAVVAYLDDTDTRRNDEKHLAD